MSDDEFVAADAEAEGCKPISVGSIKKGSYVMIKEFPCKVTDYSTAKTGKHGSAKAMYVGIDIFTGRKYEDSKPTSATAQEPLVLRKDFQLIDLDEDDTTDEGTIATLLDPETNETIDDLRLPRDSEYAAVRTAFANEKDKDIYIGVLEALGHRKILSQFTLK